MRLFKKGESVDTAREIEEYREADEIHREAAGNILKTFLNTGVFTVATMIVLVFSGIAWYAANNRVQAGTTAIAAANDYRFSIATLKEDTQGIYDQNDQKEQIGGTGAEAPSPLAQALHRFYRADRNGRDGDMGNRYTSFLNLPNLKEGESKTINGKNYILGDSDGISLMVNTQSNVNNTEEFEYLEPGSYGQLTFYIIPYIENFDQVTLSVSLQAFTLVKAADESGTSGEISGKAVPVAVDGNGVLLNMLQGHMMLFEEKDGNGNYKNRILPVLKDDGKISFEFKKDANDIQWVKGQPEPITVYWIWPRRFENIKYCGQEDSVFVSECDEHTALLNWINDNKNLIVNTEVISSSDLSDPGSGMTNQQFSRWSTGYNKGDQLIGDNVAFIQWIIRAE